MPRAPSRLLLISGLSTACLTASTALRELRPMPSSASLDALWRKIVVTSAKSTLMTPVVRMSSATQLMACCRIPSAHEKALTSVMWRFSGSFMRLSLATRISASICACIFASPSLARRFLRLPSKLNGSVTTPTESVPRSRAILATTGAAPVPVPPPRPAVTKTRSAPDIDSRILSAASRAAFSPSAMLPPVPRPFVRSSPICSVSTPSSATRESCLASVLMAIRSMSRSL